MSRVKREGNGRHHAAPHSRGAKLRPSRTPGEDVAPPGAKTSSSEPRQHDGAQRRPMIATLESSSDLLSQQRTDEQLLSAYREGNKPSFAELVSRYQRELFHFLVRFLGDRAAAEDVFQ